MLTHPVAMLADAAEFDGDGNFGFATQAEGDLVEISGFANLIGATISATRIELEAPFAAGVSEAKLDGLISKLSPTAGTISVLGSTVTIETEAPLDGTAKEIELVSGDGAETVQWSWSKRDAAEADGVSEAAESAQAGFSCCFMVIGLCCHAAEQQGAGQPSGRYRRYSGGFDENPCVVSFGVTSDGFDIKW